MHEDSQALARRLAVAAKVAVGTKYSSRGENGRWKHLILQHLSPIIPKDYFDTPLPTKENRPCQLREGLCGSMTIIHSQDMTKTAQLARSF